MFPFLSEACLRLECDEFLVYCGGVDFKALFEQELIGFCELVCIDKACHFVDADDTSRFVSLGSSWPLSNRAWTFPMSQIANDSHLADAILE